MSEILNNSVQNNFKKDEKSNNVVYLLDCIIGMKEYPDNYFDLAIVDPPYGINAANMQMGTNKTRKLGGYPSTSTATKSKGRLNSGGGKLKNRLLNKSSIDWDNEIPSEEYFNELFRVSKNQIIWGGNYFDLTPTRGFIIWNKKQPWENFSQAEFAWTSFDCPAKLFDYSNTGGANRETKIHPTQKPIFLYDYCLKKFAKEGMKILDTHLGSGSHRISADKLNLEFTAFETNEIYFKEQNERFTKYKNQIRLELNQ